MALYNATDEILWQDWDPINMKGPVMNTAV